MRQTAWAFVGACAGAAAAGALTLCAGCAREDRSAAVGAGSGERAEGEKRMDWWREARFGMFIHWGLYAVPAGEWDGQTNHAEWIRTTAQIPIDTYDQFRGRFNPVEFDADEWVRMAKAAGMRYIVITTKHHDGFCLFDSAYTDFDVMSTPFRRDIMKELSEACEHYGVRMCWYHSIMDWHHPDYLPRRDWEVSMRPEGDANFDRYTGYLFNQVTELLTNYGEIGVMWFDGEWESTWTHDRGEALYRLCRSVQPSVIVNNRVDKGRAGMQGMTTDAKFFGDFGTPEQEVPATGLPGVDWESCITMNRNWGFNAADKDFKSSAELVRMLSDIASKGGNLLLNIGPRADGTFPPESVERLRDIAGWMEVNGEAIHGTTASPFGQLPWGRCTARKDGGRTRLYLHVFEWPADGELRLEGLGSRVRSARVMGDSRRVGVEQGEGVLRLGVGSGVPASLCPVVEVVIDGSPVVYAAPVIHAPADELVGSMAVRVEPGSSGLVTRYTLDGSDPTASSPEASGPITIDRTCVLRARSFHEGRGVGGVTARSFTLVDPWAARMSGGANAGLRLDVFAGEWDRIPDLDALTPESTGAAQGVALGEGFTRERVAHRYSGLVRVPADGVYAFILTSDDGSRLEVDGRVIADNDGLHSTESKRGTAALAAGWHPVTVEWFNKSGGAYLGLEMSRADGGGGNLLDASAFSHD